MRDFGIATVPSSGVGNFPEFRFPQTDKRPQKTMRTNCLCIVLSFLCADVLAEKPDSGGKGLGVGSKITVTLKDGTRYSGAIVTRVDPDGIAIEHTKGIAKVPFADLPEEMRKRFNYDPAKAEEFRKARAPQKEQAAPAKPGFAVPTAPAAARFSADAQTLLAALSFRHKLNGQPMAAEFNPGPVVAKLCESQESDVREAAGAARKALAFRKTMNESQERSDRRIAQAAGQIPVELGKSLVRGMTGEGGSALDEAVGMTEGITGGAQGQEDVNQSYRTALEGVRVAAEVMAKLRVIANHTALPPASVAGRISARLVPPEAGHGVLEIVNRSGKPLRHCLIIPKATMDRASLRQAMKTEQGFGQLLPFMGVAPDHAQKLNEVVELRTELEAADQSSPVYLPVIPVGGSVRVGFAFATSIPVTTSVTVSLWCDEATVEDVEVAGLDAFKRGLVKNGSSASGKGGKSSGTPSQNAVKNWRNPLNDPARRVGR